MPWFSERPGRIVVILGSNYAGPTPWEGWSPKETAQVVAVRDPGDFHRRLAEVDLVLCGAGTTNYELAYLGTPFLPLVTVQNQRRVAEEWSRILDVPTVDLRDADWEPILGATLSTLMDEGRNRARMSRTGMGLVDGNGARRVLTELGRRFPEVTSTHG